LRAFWYYDAGNPADFRLPEFPDSLRIFFKHIPLLRLSDIKRQGLFAIHLHPIHTTNYYLRLPRGLLSQQMIYTALIRTTMILTQLWAYKIALTPPNPPPPPTEQKKHTDTMPLSVYWMATIWKAREFFYFQHYTSDSDAAIFSPSFTAQPWWRSWL
jgi:hypothetical protein